MIPSGIERISRAIIPPITTEIVGGAACASCALIGPCVHESPKLPWRTMRQMNFPYWTTTG